MTKILDNYKKKKLKSILEAQKDNITSINDLTGGEDPSMLFYFLADKLGYLLNNDPNQCYSNKGVKNRELANKIIKSLGPHFLKNKQIIEKNALENYKKTDKSLIYAMNHGFKDDLLATALAIPNNAYLMLASLPQFYNTFDGLLSWINGVVLMNRNVKESKASSIQKCIKLKGMNVDKIICPEGVWNKTPNSLMLPLWRGTVLLSKETGEKIVPISHYIEDSLDKSKKIYTIIDEPIDVSLLDEVIATDYLRNIIATNYYYLMEKYGQDTYQNLLEGFSNSREYWENYLSRLSSVPERYDLSTETSSDYIPKSYLSFHGDISTSDKEVNYPLNAKLIDFEFDDKAFKETLENLQYSEDDIANMNQDELMAFKKGLEKYYRILCWEKYRKENSCSDLPVAFSYPYESPINVWESIENLEENNNDSKDICYASENLEENNNDSKNISYARQLVKEEKLNNFQRRF